MHIVFIRHGQAENQTKSKPAIHRDNFDVSLTPKGISQAKEILPMLERHGINRNFCTIYCSPFNRVLQTFEVAFGTSTPHIIDPRLAEFWRGIWYTMTDDQIKRDYPEEHKIRSEMNEYHYKPPGGESMAELDARVQTFLDILELKYPDDRVCIVGHGNWEKAMERVLLQQTHEDMVNKGISKQIPNASAVVFKGVVGSYVVQYIVQ